MITLNQLFETDTYPEVVLEHIMDDSREIVPNSIFFSLQGLTHDGHAFISQAINHGAKVIVHTRDIKNKKEGIIYVYDPNLSLHYAKLVNRFYDYPSHKLNLIGVTGTNGKSSIAFLVRYLLNHFEKSASIGTLGVVYDGLIEPSKLTTNSLVNNLKILDDMVKHEVVNVVMEASSQGIDMGRIDQLNFDTAVFTNLTQDHMDYHLNMESYYQAKKKLFSFMDLKHPAIINIDDEFGLRLTRELIQPTIKVSLQDSNADYYVKDIDLNISYSKFTLIHDEVSYEVMTNLLGRYNIYNLVQALAVCHQYKKDLSECISYCEVIPQIDGRLQTYDSNRGIKVIVDFAHSPDSMQKVLSFAQSILPNNGRIITIFGSAGKRDKSKRSIMGKVADQYSSLIYLTQDDPRDERVSDICEEIAVGIFNHPYVIIESRDMAIHLAIQSARPDDIIVILGKGNENTMAVGNLNLPYDSDPKVVLNAFKELEEQTFEKTEHEHGIMNQDK